MKGRWLDFAEALERAEKSCLGKKEVLNPFGGPLGAALAVAAAKLGARVVRAGGGRRSQDALENFFLRLADHLAERHLCPYNEEALKKEGLGERIDG